ncbi:MAG: amidohydrolase family protein [Candidatus Aminicenantes bacterium]|nr:amidohydrolase family protein [Candidatus Aminicenantes bacterium]
MRYLKKNMTFILFGFCFLGFIFSCQNKAKLEIPADAMVIRNGIVIDGTGADPIQNGVVIIHNKRILAVGPASDFRLPVGVSIINAQGGAILPGLINAHVHHSASVEQRRRFLEEGVTTVCDLGTPLREMPLFAETESTAGRAARVFFAGPIITAPGGYPDGLYHTDGFNYEVATPDEAREAVRDMVARGASTIKIALDPSWNRKHPLPMLDVEMAKAIVEEAHAHGLLVHAHMIQITYFPLALEAGIDVIEHMPFPTGWPSEEEKRWYLESDDPTRPFFEDHFPEYASILGGMAQQEIVMVPTVSALIDDEYLKSERSTHEQFVVLAVIDIIRRFRKAGGIVAVGNDFNDRSMKERLPLTEMKALLDAGMTSMEVIEAATRHAALVSGADDLGILEPGKLADIIVVDGNPLEDIDALRRIKLVILDGDVAYENK